MIDAVRAATMRKRLGKRVSALVKNDQYLPRYRRVQNLVTPEEFDAMAELAERAEKPDRYFAAITSVKNFNRTLAYVKKIIARPVQALYYVQRRLGVSSRQSLAYIGDKLVEGAYSMASVVRMIELAEGKKDPGRYFIAILRRGYDPVDNLMMSRY